MKPILFTQTGFIDDNGSIAVPCVCFEDGAKVKLAIAVKSGYFEVAVFLNEADDNEDCGISEEEIQRCCVSHDNCDDCPLNEYCEGEFV